MAREVIDLISSSPPPGPSPTELPVARTTRYNDLDRAERTGDSAGVNLDGLSDEFDTTGDLDFFAPPAGTGAADAKRRPAASAGGAFVKPSLAEASLFLSDDFDTTGDLNDPILVESAGNKRRRISPSTAAARICDRWGSTGHPGSVTRPRSPALPRPPASGRMELQHRASPAGRAPVPAPQLSSDPFASPLPKSPTPPRRRKPNCDDGPPDPFASSPRAGPHTRKDDVPRMGAGDTKKHTHKSRQESPDPFASSPSPGAEVRKVIPKTRPGDMKKPYTIRQESPDPFASSPEPQQARGAKVKRRDAPDIEIISSPTEARPTSKPRSREWDPISSSAPETYTTTSHPASKKACHDAAIAIESDSDDGLNDESDDDELPDIDNLVRKPLKPRSPLRRSRSDITSTSRRKAQAPKKTTANRDRAAEKASKEAEKERKRLERQAAKDAKAREKERAAALAEVNKMRTDKKVSSREMIVDLPTDLSSRVQVETLLEELGIEHRVWESPNIVKWRRKVTSRFNEAMDHWEPIPPRIVAESHVAIVLTGDDFVKLALSDRGVASHYAGIEAKFPGHQIIYILEGLTTWMAKNRNNRNRQFTSGVRSQEVAPSGSAGRRRNGSAAEYVSEDVVEDALLELQILDALIHHTINPLETAKWLTVLTQHISTIPYRKQRNRALSAGFCMESGQVRTGDDPQDIYIRMLEEIARVTAPIARGIAAEFRSVSELVRGLESGGPGRLEGIRKTLNKEGTLSDRTVGQAVSKRMHKVFTGRDESSTDV